MLPRGNRLTRATFGQVTPGKRAISAHFSVTAVRSPEGRAAAVISKKVAKKAVERHQLRRRILDAVRSHVLPGRSFVVFARAGSPTLPFSRLKAELDELLTTLAKV